MVESFIKALSVCQRFDFCFEDDTDKVVYGLGECIVQKIPSGILAKEETFDKVTGQKIGSDVKKWIFHDTSMSLYRFRNQIFEEILSFKSDRLGFSIIPYICGKDIYTGEIGFSSQSPWLKIFITGGKKQVLSYQYY